MTGRNAGDADLTNGEPDAPAPVPLIRNRRSTLGGLKALLSKPLSGMRRRHQRVFVVAELLLNASISHRKKSRRWSIKIIRSYGFDAPSAALTRFSERQWTAAGLRQIDARRHDDGRGHSP